MLESAKALGAQVAPPHDFRPTTQWTDGPYLYLYDPGQGIVRRVPVHWRAGAGGYYQVVELGWDVELVDSMRPLEASPQSVDMTDLAPAPAKQRSGWGLRLITASLSTVFIGAALLLIYPYLPAASYQVQQALPRHTDAEAVQAAPVSDINKLTIPKIGVSANVLESPNLDILNKQEGVWHQTGSVNKGNLVLAGHRFRYLPPNSTTFYNLDKLTPGDVVVVDWLHHRYVYVVRQVQTVAATDVDVLNQVGPAHLTLYTCDDKKQTRRIVVTADPLP